MVLGDNSDSHLMTTLMRPQVERKGCEGVEKEWDMPSGCRVERECVLPWQATLGLPFVDSPS